MLEAIFIIAARLQHPGSLKGAIMLLSSCHMASVFRANLSAQNSPIVIPCFRHADFWLQSCCHSSQDAVCGSDGPGSNPSYRREAIGLNLPATLRRPAGEALQP